MRKVLFLIIIIATFWACEDKKNDKGLLPDSSGRINNINIIVSNELWEGEIGEVLRKNLASEVEGLPQQEPLFTINQMPAAAFKDFARNNRTFLKIDKSKQTSFTVVKDTFAKPQTGIFITGQNVSEIVNNINTHKDKIIRNFKAAEIAEQQRRILKSLKKDDQLEENLGVSLKFPTAYRYAKNEKDFFWIRKDIPNGSMEILVYEVPFSVIEKDTNIVGNIIKMRDSIGKKFIPGPNEDSYLATEKAFAPYLFETTIDGKFAYETKGVWDVRNAFMAGPFINYAVKDKANNRYVILEGFVFKPSATKRDNVFELEAILKSAKIN
ncbi:DUF4837 family protein [Mesonia sp. K7]|uniref:DUF4837 family protein n=1 Tax=Mesonia sp. K7 TaxID=2218606 RepID=UPI000DA81D36|nr:DUF4837 family protein [Mesonia sp. K7]PZD79122.1 DUF4837 domain-containing protein [Mesonia sp. K7]